MDSITTKINQSLIDIALQVSGTADAAYSLALANDISITDSLNVGQLIQVPTDIITNPNNLTYYKRKNIYPATAPDPATADMQGVEFWSIEIDFIVS